MNFSMERLTDLAFNAGKAIVILIIGKIVIGIVDKFVKKALGKTKLDPMLHKFIANTVKVILWAEIIIAIMTTFGFNASSLLTVLAAAGAAIALALQGSLSNLAGGILIMVSKPFKAGDYISCAGNAGVVKSIDLLHTTITTVDNQIVIIPNGTLTGNSISNYSAAENRRVDLNIGISYDSDLQKALSVLTAMAEKNEKVLSEPAVFCGVTEHADSAIILQLRSWCKSADYWDVFFALQKEMVSTLESNGIHVPFPQMDVHIK